MFRVVKLGGSLHDSPLLNDWLDALAQAGGRVVLVPGGGPFADTVRTMQGRLGISDVTAHRMALLAMEQYGLLLCDLNPGLRPAASPQAITEIVVRGLTPVWLPSSMCRNVQDVPENWSVTSDSLAAWLAHHLGAKALALVKRSKGDTHDIQALADSGQVDRHFPEIAARFGKPVHILPHDDPSALNSWLARQIFPLFAVEQASCML